MTKKHLNSISILILFVRRRRINELQTILKQAPTEETVSTFSGNILVAISFKHLKYE